MPDDPQRPDYTLYRSRPRLLRRLSGSDGAGRDGLDDLRERVPRPPGDDRPVRRRRPSVGRVLVAIALAAVAWCLVSLLLFLVSAQIQRDDIASEASAVLDDGGYTLTSPNTILILGSDARVEGKAEPGSQIGGPARSDSILLVRTGGGRNAQLSIPRDTVVDIPGRGRNKINAAYALGGPALAVETVKQFLGIEINHLVEVDFENFPELIDALGGVDVKTGCVVSLINGGRRNGGTTLRLEPGVNHLDGEQALALARTRRNQCRPGEDDRTRARRQQQILSAIKGQVLSPGTFVRLPWVSWAAPKAVRSDMAGPNLLGLVGAQILGGGAKARVLEPSSGVVLPDGGAGLIVSEAEKQAEVERFLRG